MRELRNEIESLSRTHTLLEEMFLSCRTKYEELNERNRLLDKQFKSNFLLSAPSQAVVDQAYRVFRYIAYEALSCNFLPKSLKYIM